jgi:hypothetical protein
MSMRLSGGLSSAVCMGALLSSTTFADSAVLDTRLMTLEVASKIARLAVAFAQAISVSISTVRRG